jgi:ketosteroid isomerase-like protein
MPVEPEELVKRAFHAFNEGGPSGYIEYLVNRDAVAPDFAMTIQADLPNGGEWRGTTGFERVMAIWLEAWREFEVHPGDPEELAEGRYLVPVRQRAVARGSGMELNAQFFYTVELADGRFSRVGLYADRALAERALGGP